jgi:hypothetical protein
MGRVRSDPSMNLVKRLAVLGLLVLAFATVRTIDGSPPGPAWVGGKITYQGRNTKGEEKALTDGCITFYPSIGPPYAAGIHEDGSYELADAPTGPMIVVIENKSVGPGRTEPHYKMPRDPKPLPQVANWFPIPDRYSKKARTPLRADLKPGVNELSFHLEDEPES